MVTQASSLALADETPKEQGTHWAVLGYCATVAGQLTLMKLMALLWGPTVFGQFAIVMAVVTAVTIVFFGPLGQWAVRDYQVAREESSTREYAWVVFRTTVIASRGVLAMALVAALLMKAFDLHLGGIGLTLLFLAAGLGALTALHDLVTSLLNAAGTTRTATIYIAASQIARIASVFAAFLAGLGLDEAVIVMVATQAVLLIFAWRTLNVGLSSRLIPSLEGVDLIVVGSMKETMWKYSAPFYVWGVFGYFAAMGDRWILGEFVDTSDLGKYAAMSFASVAIINGIFAAVSKALVPIIFRLSGRGNDEARVDQASRLMFRFVVLLGALCGVLILLSYAFPGLILRVLASSDFLGHEQSLWILTAAAVFFNLSQLLIMRGLIRRSPSIYLPAKLAHGITTTLSLLLLVPERGIAGAIYAVLIGNAVHFLAVLIANRPRSQSQP